MRIGEGNSSGWCVRPGSLNVSSTSFPVFSITEHPQLWKYQLSISKIFWQIVCLLHLLTFSFNSNNEVATQISAFQIKKKKCWFLLCLASSHLLFFFFPFYGCTCGICKFWASGQIGAAAAGLSHSHSNTGSQLHMQHITQLMAMPVQLLKPLREARDPTHVLMNTRSGS